MRTNSLTVVLTHDELTEAFQLWLESMQARGFSPKTLSGYKVNVGAFIRYMQQQGLSDLDSIKPAHIRRWLIHRQQKGVSNAQLHNDYRQPRTFWRWCMREELTENDPFAKVDKPRLVPVVKPVLTHEEVQALLNACEGTDWLRRRDKALILLLLDTGLRIHEAHALTVGDAKRDAVLIRGKGGKQRVVFLSAEVRLALHKYLKACPHTVHRDDAPLWWNKDGKPMTLWALIESIDRIGKRAGMPKHLGAHVFRRTYATWCLRSGIDLEHLRQLMGHSDYTVLRQYLTLVESDLKRAHQQHSPLSMLQRKRR